VSNVFTASPLRKLTPKQTTIRAQSKTPAIGTLQKTMKKPNQTLTRLHAVALGLFAATQLTSWAVSTSFTTPGGPYPFIVPAGVTSIKVQATGGGGADYQPINQPTIVTRGAVTAATLPVTPGSTLYVYVAGNGGSVKPNRGGFNGGGDGGGASGFGTGGGGGASDIRTATNDLNSRIIVAGGGGGNSFNAAGGDAGQDGSTASGTPAGAGGTNSGGAAGTFFTTPGTAGAFGQGGTGGADGGGRYGGGGGGGWYGGGGGCNWGGGAGGSSYVIPSATSVSNSLSSLPTVPKVTITYLAPSVLINPKRLGNGNYQFSFTNEPATTFTVLTSTNLTAPVAQWTAIGNPVESPAGTYQFTDSTGTNNIQRYYRVTSP
jgi:hypothetical protein